MQINAAASKSIAPAPSVDASPVTSETLLFRKAINLCALDWYREMAQAKNMQNKNFVFFTPTLLASFSMLYGGAPEKLQLIMEKALHMEGCTQEEWHLNFKAWSEDLSARSQEQFEGKPIFHFQQVQMAASHVSHPLMYMAANNLAHYDCEYTRFRTPVEAGAFVNGRVEEVTEGLIKDLVSPEDLNADLVMLMASAALFKGQWVFPFTSTENSTEVFNNSDGTKVKVEMMNQGLDNLRMAYDRADNYQMNLLELPFHGNISLLLMQPSKWCKTAPKDQLQSFMTETNMQELLQNYDERFTNRSALTIGIPKFALQEKVDVLEEFKNTALAQAIKEADFAGTLISSTGPARTPKLVSEVQFIVNEEGAKVAAASYSPTYRDSCDPQFKLNGPFGLTIIDRSSQTILAMGQVLQLPAKQ